MMKEFDYFLPTKLHFGPGKIALIGEIAKKYGKKAIIVTGKNSSKQIGVLDKVTNSLKENNIDYVIFNKIEPNPRTTTIEEGGNLAKKEKCDLVIGLGGGSPMDACKGVAVIAQNGGTCMDYVKASTPPTKALPIICITTTAGTGSEADRYAVVTNTEIKGKPVFGFECMLPVESIIDPEPMVHMIPRVTASVGIDVFFHAIESYVSKHATPVSEMFSEKAIEMVAQSLHTAYTNGTNLEARYKMAIANTLAGIAIDMAGTGLIHAMAHAVGGRYDCAHGEALASVSIGIIKHNFTFEREKYIKMANLMGNHIANDDPNALKKVIQTLKDFYEPLGLNIDITKLGANPSDIKQLTETTFSTMRICVDINPGTITKDQVEKIFEVSMKVAVV